MGSTASNVVVPRTHRWAAVWATILTLTLLDVDHGAGGASSVPTPAEITDRVVAARAAARVVSADVELRLHVHKHVTQSPDCTFTAALRFEQGRPIIQLKQRSPGVTCAIVERQGLGPLFRSLEPLEAFFARFDLSVIDQKLVCGVIPEGTVNYAWGDMETTQTYDRLNNALALTRQVLYSPRYDASLELVYSDFGFALRERWAR